MSSYSLNGYLLAIMQRSGKTLIVEGTTDQAAINRMILENQKTNSRKFIDCVEIVQDNEHLHRLGNKEKIKKVIEKIKEKGLTTPVLLEKTKALIDREWDDISISQGKITNNWTPPTPESNFFKTLGHSIENYSMCEGAICDYLKQKHSKTINHEMLESIRDNFQNILALSTSYSLISREINSLNKITGLISFAYIETANSKFYLSANIETELPKRDINIDFNFSERINKLTDEFWSEDRHAQYQKWLIHGHIGYDAIWACIAKILIAHGVNHQTALGVERSSKNDRECFLHDWVSTKLDAINREPLDSAVAWVTN